MEKAQLTRKINIEIKYGLFISELITELKNNNGILVIGEVYKIFTNRSIGYIKSAIILMKKSGLIYSIPKASKSQIVLNER